MKKKILNYFLLFSTQCPIISSFVIPQHSSSSLSNLFLSKTLDGKAIQNEFTPINDMVLVRLDKKDEQTKGGLLLASKTKVKRDEGTVVKVGTGKLYQDSGIRLDVPVEPGDKVLYGKFDGQEINLDGIPHILLRDSDILVRYSANDDAAEGNALSTARLLRDNVLVKVLEKDEATSVGGILLAQSTASKTRPNMGTVIKVGPGRVAVNGVLMEMDVKEGDMIRYRDFMGNTVVVLDEQEYSVVRMNDILAKF